ncbi:MAG: DUF5654 family protein [Candidatus Curtissbacteria bacterium]|nr:DUF5654 family protein [Candidatus Curtissbacteria bacterium]
MAKKNKKLTRELLRQMITLSTSGFGLVAALAWNEAIQAIVREYVDRYLPSGAGVVSKLLYALLITLLAVFITYQLSRIIADED